MSSYAGYNGCHNIYQYLYNYIIQNNENEWCRLNQYKYTDTPIHLNHGITCRQCSHTQLHIWIDLIIWVHFNHLYDSVKFGFASILCTLSYPIVVARAPHGVVTYSVHIHFMRLRFVIFSLSMWNFCIHVTLASYNLFTLLLTLSTSLYVRK